MKITKRLKAVTIVSAAVISLTAFSIALAAEYSADDPIISKSYLDSVFYNQITNYVDTKIAESKQTAAPQASTEYAVITLTQGQSLYAASSLELILRPGAGAKVISPIAENGIANLTHGTEIYNGEDIPINAYCIIPRADGRGIQCTSGTAYILVRGAYEIR